MTVALLIVMTGGRRYARRGLKSRYVVCDGAR